MTPIGAGHDRVPAETERDLLPNCQWTARTREATSVSRAAGERKI